MHSRQHNDEVQFYAFDALMSDGDDLRKLPLNMRKASLARLLARRINGIFLSDFEHQGEIGPDLFRHACMLGLEGLHTPNATIAPYPRGRLTSNWVKVKNPEHPAMAKGESVLFPMRPILRGKYLDERLRSIRVRKPLTTISDVMSAAGGLTLATLRWSITAGPLPHPAIDQPQ